MYELQLETTFEETIKKSLFIVHAAPVYNITEAMSFLKEKSHPDATHNCWAYKIADEYRFNDDGEPGGTAGRPILQAIEGHNLNHIVVLVIRYFGGIKLGTGGLVRAYGGCANKCLQEARIKKIIPKVKVSCSCEYSEMERVKARIIAYDTNISFLNEEFNERGVQWLLDVPSKTVKQIEEEFINWTRGQEVWSILDDS